MGFIKKVNLNERRRRDIIMQEESMKRLMMQRLSIVLIVAFMLIPLVISAEWVEEDNLIPPPGYEEAWKQKEQYDEIFYRMMQLGRGIVNGDKIVVSFQLSNLEFPEPTVKLDQGGGQQYYFLP